MPYGKDKVNYSERQWEAEAKLFLCLVSTYIVQNTIFKRGEALKWLLEYNYVTIYLPYGTIYLPYGTIYHHTVPSGTILYHTAFRRTDVKYCV